MANFGRPNNGNSGGNQGRNPSAGAPLLINEPRCHVCQSPHRRDVDRYLAMGLSQAEICRFFEALDGTTFTRKSMSTHKSKHLTLSTNAVRSIIEEEARETIANIDEIKTFMLTKKAAVKIAMQKAFESMMSGETVVEPEVMLKMIEKLEAWEREEQEATVDEMKRDFNAFAAAVKELIEWIAPKMIEEFRVSSDDLFSMLYERYETALNSTSLPLVIRGMNVPILPQLEMPDDIDDADFDDVEGGDSNGSE